MTKQPKPAGRKQGKKTVKKNKEDKYKFDDKSCTKETFFAALEHNQKGNHCAWVGETLDFRWGPAPQPTDKPAEGVEDKFFVNGVEVSRVEYKLHNAMNETNLDVKQATKWLHIYGLSILALEIWRTF